MSTRHIHISTFLASFATVNCASALAATDYPNTAELGYVHVSFNTSSDELTGPPGTTPPGATVGLKDTDTLAILYSRHMSGPVSLVLQGGVPPEVHLFGHGTAAALGEVGETRAWFPGILVVSTLPRLWTTTPYVGVGINYTFFSGTHVQESYTEAVQGSSTTASLSPHAGAIAKAGATIAIAPRWILDFNYSHYWIKTTATVNTETPGVGLISRHVNISVNPDILGLSVGYLF